MFMVVQRRRVHASGRVTRTIRAPVLVQRSARRTPVERRGVPAVGSAVGGPSARLQFLWSDDDSKTAPASSATAGSTVLLLALVLLWR